MSNKKEYIKEYYKQWYQLPKGKKSMRITQWKYRGLKETKEFIEQIYDEYLNSEECQLCGEPYSAHNIKSMDHCHTTGKFRNIICNRCNCWKADKAVKNIFLNKKYYYVISIFREGKYIINTSRKTKEDALALIEETKLTYPWYFT